MDMKSRWSRGIAVSFLLASVCLQKTGIRLGPAAGKRGSPFHVGALPRRGQAGFKAGRT